MDNLSDETLLSQTLTRLGLEHDIWGQEDTQRSPRLKAACWRPNGEAALASTHSSLLCGDFRVLFDKEGRCLGMVEDDEFVESTND